MKLKSLIIYSATSFTTLTFNSTVASLPVIMSPGVQFLTTMRLPVAGCTG